MSKLCVVPAPEEDYTKPMSIMTMLLVAIILALSVALAVSLVLGNNDRRESLTAAAKDKTLITTLTAQLAASQDRAKQCLDIKSVAMKLGQHPVTMTGTLVVFSVPGGEM